MDQRFDRLERKVDDLSDAVQGIASGHTKRFDSIERRLGGGRDPLRMV
jgi:hypothetical protein